MHIDQRQLYKGKICGKDSLWFVGSIDNNPKSYLGCYKMGTEELTCMD